MSKRVVSLVTIWLLLSTLVQATGRPALERRPIQDAPAAGKLNVELLGHWSDHNVLDLEVRGDLAFMSYYDGSSDAFGHVWLVDVSDPTDPHRRAGPDLITAGLYAVFKAVSADDQFVYVAEESLQGSGSSVEAYTESNLEEFCSYYTDSSMVEMWTGATPSGEYLFVAQRNGLLVDGSEQGEGLNCGALGTYEAPSELTAAAHTADFAYLGTSDGRLLVVDVAFATKPSDPKEKSRSVLLPGGIDAMAAAPGVVYLAQGTTIKIVDVSNPASPVVAKTFTSPVAVAQLGVASGYLYAASAGGLYVFDVGDNNAPNLAGYYLDQTDGGFGGALYLANGLVYTGGPGGLNILRFAPGDQPKGALLIQPGEPGSVSLNGVELSYPCELQMPALGAKGPVVDAACAEGKQGDKVEILKKRTMIYMYVGCIVTMFEQFRRALGVRRLEDGDRWLVSVAFLGAHVVCSEKLPSRAQDTASPYLVLDHESGALQYSFLLEEQSVEVRTQAVAIRSDGANTVSVDHDPQANRTTVSCYSGSLTLTPKNSSLPPFTLGASQEVEVTAESVSPIEPIDYPYSSFLPLTARAYASAPPSGWRTLLREDFEGVFPGAWSVADGSAGSGEHHWASRTCRPQAGGRSGWAVGGGFGGAALPCGSDYPPEVEGWMMAGPFDLSDATAAEVTFQRWLNSESEDRLLWLASADGVNFQGWQDSGAVGDWQETVFDLTNVPGLGDLTGDPDVWIAFVYSSDAAGSKPEGAYVDDILMRKYLPATGGAQSAPQPGARQAAPQETEELAPASWVLPAAGVERRGSASPY